MAERKKLRDILHGGALDDLAKTWDATKAAGDHQPIPAGSYRCRVVEGAVCESRKGTPGYKLTFEVADGAHARRRVWCDLWLSPAALAMTKRDLAKLGIESADQLDKPLPEGFIVEARVALQTGDDGRQFNKVRSFEVVAFEPPAPDPFAPVEPPTVEPPADELEHFEL